jgi:hypothetical protein
MGNRLHLAGVISAKTFNLSTRSVGIALAPSKGMAIFTATPDGAVTKAEWLHWLYAHGNRTISCSLDVRGDGLYIATVIPLWSPEEQIVEKFQRPGDAMRWQEVMGQHLHATGWLLVECGAVTNAA